MLAKRFRVAAFFLCMGEPGLLGLVAVSLGMSVCAITRCPLIWSGCFASIFLLHRWWHRAEISSAEHIYRLQAQLYSWIR